MIYRNSVVSPQGYLYNLAVFASRAEYESFNQNPGWVGSTEGIIFMLKSNDITGFEIVGVDGPDTTTSLTWLEKYGYPVYVAPNTIQFVGNKIVTSSITYFYAGIAGEEPHTHSWCDSDGNLIYTSSATPAVGDMTYIFDEEFEEYTSITAVGTYTASALFNEESSAEIPYVWTVDEEHGSFACWTPTRNPLDGYHVYYDNESDVVLGTVIR